MPEPTDRNESVARADNPWFAPADNESISASLRLRYWSFPAGLLSSLLAVFGASEVAASTAVQLDHVALEGLTGSAAAQTAPHAFRDTRRVSLRDARRIVFEALRRAEAARFAEREEEARFWASLGE